MCTAIAVVVGLVTTAHAESKLDAARQAIDASDYPSASISLGELLVEGVSGPRELAEIYRLKGIVAAAMGDHDAAVHSFQRAHALNPSVSLAAGTSPKIRRPFDEAKAAMGDELPLEISVRTTERPPAVSLVIDSDPFAMAARVRVFVAIDGAAEQVIERPVAAEVTVAVPDEGKRLDLRVVVIDQYGNAVAEHGSKQLPIVIVRVAPEPEVTPPPPPPVPERSGGRRPVVLRAWLWGGAAVATAGFATYFGLAARGAEADLRALTDASSDHRFDEARSLASRGERDARLSNIGFVAAGVFAVAAVVLYATDSSEQPPRATASAAVVPGGGAVMVRGWF